MSRLFEGVKYIVHRSLGEKDTHEVLDLLYLNGGKEVELEKEATHIITDSFDVGIDMEKEGKRIHLVTPTWVRRCVTLGLRQEERFYSPDPRMLFSGIVGCSSDLPVRDAEVIQAGIVGLGGQWRGPLTKEVTHLFVLSPIGDKYNTALKHQHRTHMKIVLPHWFDDSFKAAHLVPTRLYEFPNPPVLQPGGSALLEPWKHDDRQSQLYKSMQYAKEGTDMAKIQVKQNELFSNQRVLLSDALALTAQRKEAFEVRIQDAGGTIVQSVANADVLITPLQDGHEFYSAYRKGKKIGTLEWLVYVLREGRLSNPKEQLIHFPHPKGPCGRFKDYEITVTNYSGPSRDYVKLLIEALGGKFTPTMSGSNTHVVAGYCAPNEPVSAKIQRAHDWHIPVVNHLWLEDCFAIWKELPISGEKYAMRNIQFTGILGDKREVVVNVPKQELEAQSESETEAEESPVKTGRSAKSADSVQSTPTRKKPGTNGDTKMDDEPAQPEDEDEVEGLVDNAGLYTPTGTARSAAKGRMSQPGTPRTGIVPATSSPAHIGGSANSKRRPLPSPSKEDRPSKRTRLSSQASPPPLKNGEVLEISDESDGPSRKPMSKPKSPVQPKPKSATRPFLAPRSPSPTSDTELPDDPMEGIDLYAHKKATTPSKPGSSSRSTRKPPPPSSPLTQEDEPMSEVVPPARARAALTTSRRGRPAARASSPSVPDLPASSSVPSSSALAAANTTTEGHRPKRNAAVAAEKSLHDAMEDANRFSREMRHKGHLTDMGSIKLPEERKAKEREKEVVILESDDSADDHPTKVQKKGRAGREAKENTPGSVPEKKRPGAPSSRTGGRVASGSKRGATVTDDDNDPVPVEKPKRTASGRSGAKTTAKKSESPPRREVKAITTQVNLTAQEQRSLEALGVTLVMDPRECTHVIAKGISRTEKFLVAMANAPKIVTKEWALKSIEKGELLSEDAFAVKDAAKETDYSFKLSEALARASKQPLMKNLKFHITPSVKVDFQSLKKIIEACGGKAIKLVQPLTKELGENQYLVSCEEDDKFWRAVVEEGEETVVYSQELILTGALKQELAWGDPSVIIAGSTS